MPQHSCIVPVGCSVNGAVNNSARCLLQESCFRELSKEVCGDAGRRGGAGDGAVRVGLAWPCQRPALQPSTTAMAAGACDVAGGRVRRGTASILPCGAQPVGELPCGPATS